MPVSKLIFFFFNDTATTEIYTLSLHDALPISRELPGGRGILVCAAPGTAAAGPHRSEEHTSELQSPCNLVCRLLLEKKKTICSSPHALALLVYAWCHKRSRRFRLISLLPASTA